MSHETKGIAKPSLAMTPAIDTSDIPGSECPGLGDGFIFPGSPVMPGFGASVLNALTAHVAVLDKKGAIVAVNQAWLDFARSNEASDLARLSVGANYLEVCASAGDDPLAIQALRGIQEVLDGKKRIFTLEYPCPSPVEEHWFLMVVTRPHEGIGGAVVVHTDITDREHSRRALQASEARFHSVLENMSEGLMLFDAEENLIYQNPASLRIHGFEAPSKGTLRRDELPVTWKAWDLSGRTIGFEEWPVSRVFRYEQFQNQVLRVIRVETGREFHGSYNGCPICDASGRLVLGFITIRDISGEVQARRALEQSERRLRAFFESDMMGAICWTTSGRITDANDKFLQMVGYDREELISGRISWERMTPEYRARDENALRELESRGSDTPYEKEFIRKDGTRMPVLVGASMLDDKHYEGVAFVLDITERKRAEEVLARSKADLEVQVAERTAELQELIGELEHFSYTITHDMRAPLRAMQGYGEMLKELCSDSGDGRKELVQKIIAAANRMDLLITDALSYNRAVRQELPLCSVDTGKLVRDILDTYPEFQPARAHIQIDGELPVVLANEAGLTQCFSNLLGNAVKFVKAGEKPQVRIWAEPRGEYERIWVEDRGIGITKHMIPRLFEMFARGSNNYEGTGIGLALVRKVALRMGGKVGVESREGDGSRFWLECKTAGMKQKEIPQAGAILSQFTGRQQPGA
jgi:PAS domain S-box-containing protein